MKVTICDHCHKEVKGTRYELGMFVVVVGIECKYELRNKEFCSLHCQQAYIINGLKGRGLDDHIKV